MEDLFFTIIDHRYIEPKEVRLNFRRLSEVTEVQVGKKLLAVIDKQQLGELGSLFLFLAADGCDYDSIPELLDGFGVTSEEMKRMTKRLSTAIDEWNS